MQKTDKHPLHVQPKLVRYENIRLSCHLPITHWHDVTAAFAYRRGQQYARLVVH